MSIYKKNRQTSKQHSHNRSNAANKKQCGTSARGVHPLWPRRLLVLFLRTVETTHHTKDEKPKKDSREKREKTRDSQRQSSNKPQRSKNNTNTVTKPAAATPLCSCLSVGKLFDSLLTCLLFVFVFTLSFHSLDPSFV